MKEFLYKVLNIATFGRGMKRIVNGHTLRLPTRFYRFFPDNYEHENFEFLFSSVKKGDVVLDVGAHIGLFAVIAAQTVSNEGKVYAFEPTPATYQLLQTSVAINNNQNNIKIFQKAVGSSIGKITFFISDNKADNANSLVNYKEDRPLHGIDIDVTTIDAFVKEQNLTKINFIKIDVEGAEYDALKGSVETFNKFKPACILAIHPEPIKAKGDSLETIFDFIQQLNYKILYNNKPISKEAFCASTDLLDLHLLP